MRAIQRRKPRSVKIGPVSIGSGFPIAIQSMAKTPTHDVEATVRQINELQKAGCALVRVAVKDASDAAAIAAIKRHIGIPLVADIHFDWRLAVAAIEHGADKIRLNPGNIHKTGDIARVVAAARGAHIPIRVGLNSGSLPALKGDHVRRMVNGAVQYIRRLEKMKFRDIVVSLKASSVRETIEAYRLVSTAIDYPLHLGMTATGFPRQGMIKSSIAIGVLLLEGIGDTIRISLTDKPVEEVKAAQAILEAVGAGTFGPQMISCPTCGRCEVDLVAIVRELEAKLGGFSCRTPVKVAVMGCVVNGPGEAKDADIGVAFGKKEGLLFKRGKPVRKIAVGECVKVLCGEIARMR